MSIINYLLESLNDQIDSDAKHHYTSGEEKESLKLKNSINKLPTNVIIDDSDIQHELLGDYVKFDNDEYNHFKHKSLIFPDYIDRLQAKWDWNDENLEDYIVTIKKRIFGDKFIYEVIQTGDAEITNKHNKYQGSDRDVYSKPFDKYDFDFVHKFLSDLGILE